MSAPARPKKRHAIGPASELPPGARRVVKIPTSGRDMEVGVFNVGGRVVAYRNICPHAGAPVCEGRVCGTTLPSAVGEYILAREGEILRCPWHGWEFDLLTGEHLVDGTTRLRAYSVETTGGKPADDLEAFEIETHDETLWLLV